MRGVVIFRDVEDVPARGIGVELRAVEVCEVVPAEDAAEAFARGPVVERSIGKSKELSHSSSGTAV